jgi:hypothetical protein
MPILRCVALLRSATAPPGLTSVAVVALAQAVQEQLGVPHDTGRLLWEALKRNPDANWATFASEACGTLATADLVADVLACVVDANVGASLCEAGLDILSGRAAASLVTDRDLLAIAERARGPLVRPASNVVRAVCEARRVPQDVVVAIAGGWSRRRDLGARITSLDLVDLLPPIAAQKLVEAALSDEHSGVRATATFRIVDVFDRVDGLVVVDRALAIETNNKVAADLLAVKGELLALPPA